MQFVGRTSLLKLLTHACRKNVNTSGLWGYCRVRYHKSPSSPYVTSPLLAFAKDLQAWKRIQVSFVAFLPCMPIKEKTYSTGSADQGVVRLESVHFRGLLIAVRQARNGYPEEKRGLWSPQHLVYSRQWALRMITKAAVKNCFPNPLNQSINQPIHWAARETADNLIK